MKYIGKAVDAGLTEIFKLQDLPEETRGRLRSAFLKGFENELKAGLVKQAMEEQAQITHLQKGKVIPSKGNIIHAKVIGDLSINALSWKNWVRILFRKTIQNLSMVVATHEMQFEEKVMN